MRSLRIRNPTTAPPEETPLDVWLEPNGGSQVNVWIGNTKGRLVVARLQLGNFKGDVHLRLPVLERFMAEALGVSPGFDQSSLSTRPRLHIAINKE